MKRKMSFVVSAMTIVSLAGPGLITILAHGYWS